MSGQENIKSGIIQFTSYESNSKSVIKWSSGQAYNGVRDIKIAFSENMSCRQDMSLKTRTIFCPEENTIKIVFDEPQIAITPGQFAAIYQKKLLLGAGVITNETP